MFIKNEQQLNQAKEDTLLRQQRHARETRIIRKIVFVIIAIILLVGTVVMLGLVQKVSTDLQPYDVKQTEKVEVTVEAGMTFKQIAKLLEEKKIIRSATAFNFYIKTKEVGGIQAGNYALSPSMQLSDILDVLKKGGIQEHAVLSTVLVREGDNVEQIADALAKSAGLNRDEVLQAVNDAGFIEELVAKYPQLLTSMKDVPDLKYRLEGYLFPATYDYRKDDTVKVMLEKMVKKMDDVMHNYYESIAAKKLTVHQVLTLASLAEKEGVKTDDRKKIISVFNNRLEAGMPLQSDISILYALGEHREKVYNVDLEVDSPYNLYKNNGYGPGPFDSPSEDAIIATIEPDNTDYVYFVADTTTGKVYFARTLAEHNALVSQYVK